MTVLRGYKGTKTTQLLSHYHLNFLNFHFKLKRHETKTFPCLEKAFKVEQGLKIEKKNNEMEKLARTKTIYAN